MCHYLGDLPVRLSYAAEPTEMNPPGGVSLKMLADIGFKDDFDWAAYVHWAQRCSLPGNGDAAFRLEVARMLPVVKMGLIIILTVPQIIDPGIDYPVKTALSRPP